MRSCYTAQCKFSSDPAAPVYNIRWFFCPDGAPALGRPTVFFSKDWRRGDWWPVPALGEVVGGARAWDAGSPPPTLSYQLCGPDSGWDEGLPLSEMFSVLIDGFPPCCFGVVVAVADVFCDDDSITVNPHTGHVILHLNVAHANVWQILQTFTPADADSTALLAKAFVSQVADLVRVEDSDGNTLAAFAADGQLRTENGASLGCTVEVNKPLEVRDPSDTVTWAVDQLGELQTAVMIPATAVGTVVGVFELQDTAGTTLGFVPVYDSYTPPSAHVIEDDFVDTDGTSLPSHTVAPVNTPGHSWVNVAGTWDIQSDHAENASLGGGSYSVCSIDAELSDGTITAVVNFPTTSVRGGIAFRCSDGSNFFIAYLGIVAGKIQLYRVQAGGFTLLDEQTWSGSTGTDYTLQVVITGDAIGVTIDGLNGVSATDSFNQTVTKHGLYFDNATGGLCAPWTFDA